MWCGWECFSSVCVKQVNRQTEKKERGKETVDGARRRANKKRKRRRDRLPLLCAPITGYEEEEEKVSERSSKKREKRIHMEERREKGKKEKKSPTLPPTRFYHTLCFFCPFSSFLFPFPLSPTYRYVYTHFFSYPILAGVGGWVAGAISPLLLYHFSPSGPKMKSAARSAIATSTAMG